MKKLGGYIKREIVNDNIKIREWFLCGGNIHKNVVNMIDESVWLIELHRLRSSIDSILRGE